ncbi:MAG: GxxExxY protein [Saprospiraceae bacterium]
MAIEFAHENISFQRELEMPIFYRDEQIGTRRVDFFVEEKVMVELKAIENLKECIRHRQLTIWKHIILRMVF